MSYLPVMLISAPMHTKLFLLFLVQSSEIIPLNQSFSVPENTYLLHPFLGRGAPLICRFFYGSLCFCVCLSALDKI